MKKILATIMTCFCIINLNAQEIQYPQEWGTMVETYDVPVPVGNGAKCEFYTLVRTNEGVGFIGKEIYFFSYKEDVTVRTVKVNGKTYYEAPNGDLCVNRPMQINDEYKKINGAYFDNIGGNSVFTPAICEARPKGAIVWYASHAMKRVIRVSTDDMRVARWWAINANDQIAQQRLGLI